jgi:hypothetical protein
MLVLGKRLGNPVVTLIRSTRILAKLRIEEREAIHVLTRSYDIRAALHHDFRTGVCSESLPHLRRRSV